MTQRFANRVRDRRRLLGWSQDQLATKAGVSRAAVSAIEIQRIVPSVAAALSLADALSCTVEDLFGSADKVLPKEEWAWPPLADSCRFWQALIGNRVLRYPTEATVAGILPHDGVFRNGNAELVREFHPDRTLVIASCDPAAGLIAAEYERMTGMRLLPVHRTSRESLELLGKGLIHVAGLHLAAESDDEGNAKIAKSILGDGYSVMRIASWDEGLAARPGLPIASMKAILQSQVRWIGRESGGGARDCQDELLGNRPAPRRIAKDHQGVAEAIRCGWADVGVCLRLVSDQARLAFVPIRQEAYDLCFPQSLEGDPRLNKLRDVLRSAALQSQFSALPGYRLSRDLPIRHG